METYIVLYRIESIMTPLDSPFGFRCQADDPDHAEEQCIAAYPDCAVVWVSKTSDYALSLEDYYNYPESAAA